MVWFVLPFNFATFPLSTEKEKDMRAMLVAAGPRIRQAGQLFAVKPYSNVHVYSLLAEMLGVKPAPNNGTWGALSSVVLRK
jgi:ectonucleotide pyrophosphatase/phosphodiesterase family protein 1/3